MNFQQLDKTLMTNGIAAILVIIGFVSPIVGHQIKSVGFFALSGALTNWLAVHMLFEKVPYLYGSGVIPNQFATFRTEIRKLIMTQFFTYENILRYFNSEETTGALSSDSVIEQINFDKVFNAFVEAILNSPFGSMVNMFGGQEVIETLKEPIISNLKKVIVEVLSTDMAKLSITSSTEITKVILDKIEGIVEQRLNELTPQMVKIIVQEMIRSHLGWLVVWGGVFGGLIGLLVSFIP